MPIARHESKHHQGRGPRLFFGPPLCAGVLVDSIDCACSFIACSPRSLKGLPCISISSLPPCAAKKRPQCKSDQLVTNLVCAGAGNRNSSTRVLTRTASKCWSMPLARNQRIRRTKQVRQNIDIATQHNHMDIHAHTLSFSPSRISQ